MSPTPIAKYLFRVHLEPSERILQVCHRHIFVILPDLLRIGFFGFLVPMFLYFMFPEFSLIFIMWVLVGAIKVFYVLFNWYHDSLLITDVSLIKVEWNGFFDRVSSRLEYQNIDGISYSLRGFRRTVFNYGDVQIGQTANSTSITLKDAVNPARVERLVLSHQEHFVSDQNLKDADSLKSLLTIMLRHHSKTQGTGKPAPQLQKIKKNNG